MSAERHGAADSSATRRSAVRWSGPTRSPDRSWTIVELVEPQLRDDQIEAPEHEIFTRIPNYVGVAARRTT
jgi:hypothetical protein